MKLNLIFCSIIIFTLIFLSGCKNTKIQFNRKSSFEEFKKTTPSAAANKRQSKIINSKGIIIYKTNDTSNQRFNVKFGPQDINFNLDK